MIDYIELIKSTNCVRAAIYQEMHNDFITMELIYNDSTNRTFIYNPAFTLVRLAGRCNKLLLPPNNRILLMDHHFSDSELKELKLLTI